MSILSIIIYSSSSPPSSRPPHFYPVYFLTSLEGINYPITSIIITNICGATSGQEFYTESSGDRSGLSTIFEIMAIEPYVNPWNEIEYYKILFNRSDKQVIVGD
jgi:hypothetical protein